MFDLQLRPVIIVEAGRVVAPAVSASGMDFITLFTRRHGLAGDSGVDSVRMDLEGRWKTRSGRNGTIPELMISHTWRKKESSKATTSNPTRMKG